jgi:hypothetical protein
MAITWDIKELKTDANNGVNYVLYFAWDEEVTGEGLESRSYHGYYDALKVTRHLTTLLRTKL